MVPDGGTPPGPIFIGGAGRSGTTLLRVMLDSHPRISCGPELKVGGQILKLWQQLRGPWFGNLMERGVGPEDVDALFRDLFAGLLRPYQATSGKLRLAEKTPNNIFWFRQLGHLFGDAQFVHVLRDGRDVVASLLNVEWYDPTGHRLPITTDAIEAARYWAESVEAGLDADDDPAIRGRLRLVRYEDLVTRPESTLRSLLEFLNEPWDAAVLEHQRHPHDLARESSADRVAAPIDAAAVGRWRRDLTEGQREAIGPIIARIEARLRGTTSTRATSRGTGLAPFSQRD